jgi:predicted DNA-binding WGR domain protein
MFLKNNNKFWSIDLNETKVVIRYGKINKDNEEEAVQIVEKEFPSVNEA